MKRTPSPSRDARASHRSRTLAFALCSALGCGPKDEIPGAGETGAAMETDASMMDPLAPTEGAASSGSDGGAQDVAPPPEGCTCIDTAEAEEEGRLVSCSENSLFDCGEQEDLCPVVAQRCPRATGRQFYPCEIEFVIDEEALTCALEALRDRKRGVLRFGVPTDLCGWEGCGWDFTELLLLAESEVAATTCNEDPLAIVRSRRGQRGKLKPPEHFEGCLALELPDERWSCLFAGVTDEQPSCD